ncbi:MAG TPA: hypothetical protein VFS08_18000 [Gemmatimonadaceae bacterium]|nr:hypothetical protein [Gemmatimonadaceae bacterium]
MGADPAVAGLVAPVREKLLAGDGFTVAPIPARPYRGLPPVSSDPESAP